MKAIQLTLFLLTIVICGCNRKESNSEETLLIYPNNEVNVNPCCFDFKWISTFPKDFQFSVSGNESFDPLIIDTLLHSKSISFGNSFEPNKKYYWRVKHGDLQSTSSFIIKDVLIGIDKSYPNASIYRYNYTWGMPNSGDTTFTDTVLLSRSADSLLFDYPDGNIHRTLVYAQLSYPDIIRYRSIPQFGSTGCDIILNYINDSILIDNWHGGLGQGTRWKIWVKK